ncbi:MAG: YgaP family membrane protein [Halioglobus sp.]
MIERNIGNTERIVRLLFGILFGAWSLSQPHMNVVEWFVAIVSLALILNGVFSRCYLWYVLDIDTNKSCRDVFTAGNNC